MPSLGICKRMPVFDTFSVYSSEMLSHCCGSGQIDERTGPAVESLEMLLTEGHADSFDFAFIGIFTAPISAFWIATLPTCCAQSPWCSVTLLWSL